MVIYQESIVKKCYLVFVFFTWNSANFIFTTSNIYLYVAIGFGVFYGYLWLFTIPPTNGIISQVFGTKYLAMLYGIVFFSNQNGSFFELIFVGIFMQYGSYDYVWYLFITLSFFATVVQ